MTRCARPHVECLYVSTVTDSPSQVLATAAAPIWYDARLRSHLNGMRPAGLAGSDWGLLHSPHALAVRIHQYISLSFFLLTYSAAELASQVPGPTVTHCRNLKNRTSQKLKNRLSGAIIWAHENDPWPISYKK